MITSRRRPGCLEQVHHRPYGWNRGLALAILAGVACSLVTDLWADEPKPPSSAKPLSAAQLARLKERDRLAAEVQTLHQGGKLAEAQAATAKKLAIEREVLGNVHQDVADSLGLLAELHIELDEFPQARAAYQEVLSIRSKLHGEYHYSVADARRTLGDIDLRSRRSANERASLRRAEELSGQAEQLYDQARYPQATELLQKALALKKELYPRSQYPQGHPDLAKTVNYLGLFQSTQGEYGKAEAAYLEALAMRRTLYPKHEYPHGHPDLAESLANVGLALRHQGEYSKAQPFLRDDLAMTRALYPKEQYPQGHADLASSLSNMGLLLSSQGEYDKAEPFLREALAMRRALYGKEQYPRGHLDLATSLNNLGSLFQSQGEYGKAESFFRDCLAMSRELYPKEKYPKGHPYLARVLNNLALLLQARGEYRQAEPLHREDLAIMRALYPKEKYPHGHPELALSLNNLGGLLLARGEYVQAEIFLHEALAMRQMLYPHERYPQGHPHLVQSLSALGVFLRTRGEYNKAEPFFRDALAMNQALYPREKYPHGHPDLTKGLTHLGFLLQIQGEARKAKPIYERALAMQHSLVALYADAASEIQGLNYLAQLPATRDFYLSLPHEPINSSPDEVYAPIWRGRAALTRIFERRQRALFAAHDRAVRELAEQLLATRRLLARLLFTPAGAAKNHEQRLRDLTDRKEDLERQLAHLLPSSALPVDADAPPHTELVKHLPEYTVFIDLIRYSHFVQDPKVRGPKGESHTASYVAFVLRKGRPVQRVELGPAKAIENALSDWRQTIADAGVHPASTHPPKDRTASAALTVGQLVWEPIARHLAEDTRTVYLAPDGALTRLPWAALPGKRKGTVLLEDLTLALVPHGPYLLRSLTSPAAKADPNADLFLTVCGVAYGQKPQPLETAAENLASLRSPALGLQGVRWSDLPGTQVEVDRILALAGRFPRRNLRGSAASTGQLEADLPQARWAHLATHGFFADASFRSVLQLDEKEFAYAGLRDRSTAGARNPLVLSGLVLAGANLPPGKDQDPLTYDHGIATAETLTALDLRKLELVVLSACETGLGDVAGGEGVFGLQRAFHMAGARNVITSLWKVNDQATAALMALFYHQLWKENQPPIAALREAQLYLYRRPEQIATLARTRGPDFDKVVRLPKDTTEEDLVAQPPAKANIKLWAGFVLSGPGN
jgi:CHAT domain-containing protein/Tfp pilus assembly protein PilF